MSFAFRRFGLVLPALLLAGLSARAENAAPRCVIELFTSQGCSSCPPADKLAGELSRDARNIVVSFPVDYWDYIGWKDTLASPAFTARQKAYASARGDGHVYTPQAVIDGLSHAVGSDRADIESSVVANAGKGALRVPIRLTSQGGTVRVEVGDGTGGAGGVWLIRIAQEKTVAIGRGENSGRSVTYTNVARSLTKLGDWAGKAQSFEVPLAQTQGPDSDGYVVILQSGTPARPGVILGAAKS
jgi:hypothetical protein